MKIAIVVAMDENRVIGRGNDLPWRGKLPADLKRFKELTTGHAVIMGRKTYESIGRPLPGRINIVVTSRESYAAPGCWAVRSLESALALAYFTPEMREAHRTVFIIGGSSLYTEALGYAERIYLTRVHDRFEGDIFFPVFDGYLWEVVWSEYHERDAKNLYPYSFAILQRIARPSAEPKESRRPSVCKDA